MASLLDLNKPHFAFYSVPAALFLAFVPHTYAAIAAGKNFDVAQPRTNLTNCEKDTSLDKKTLQRIQRAEAASTNGFETLGLYAGGVVAAVAAGVPTPVLNYLGAGYLASRVVYNIIYVFLQDNRKVAPLRSVVWNMSVGIIITLWVKAGNMASTAAAALM